MERRTADQRPTDDRSAVDRDTVDDGRGRWGADETIVAAGDRHDRGVEYLCVGEAA